ncbi:rCG38912, partial [Rattus norvegicus]
MTFDAFYLVLSLSCPVVTSLLPQAFCFSNYIQSIQVLSLYFTLSTSSSII